MKSTPMYWAMVHCHLHLESLPHPSLVPTAPPLSLQEGEECPLLSAKWSILHVLAVSSLHVQPSEPSYHMFVLTYLRDVWNTLLLCGLLQIFSTFYISEYPSQCDSQTEHTCRRKNTECSTVLISWYISSSSAHVTSVLRHRLVP